MPDAVPVLLNPAAGSGPDRAAVEAAFAACGLAVAIRTFGDDRALAELLDEILRTRPPLVVAGGGDGTVAAVAARLVDGESALGVLPLGTLNHFAKDLGLPLDLDRAAHAIARGDTRRIDVGEVDGRCFLNNSSLGLYPRIVLAREHAQKRLHLGKWPALARATWQALRNPRALTVALEVDGERLQRRTPFLFVGNNRYVLAGMEAGTRPALDGGVLSLHVLRPQSPLGFVWMALRTLCGLRTRERDFERFLVHELQVQTGGDSLEVACDGEVAPMPLPLRFRVRPRALRVVVAGDAG
jgi:YegS/Rv2252/BmrU family lipid kinase